MSIPQLQKADAPQRGYPRVIPEQKEVSLSLTNLLISLVRPKRFERSTSTSGVLRSIQLSYGRTI